MKSNIEKFAKRVLKALETSDEVLIRPRSHNELNQIDIALKRVGIHGLTEWTPRLARNLATTFEKFDSRQSSNVLTRARLFGEFGPDYNCQVYVLVTKCHKTKTCYSQVHNHKCSHETFLEY